MTGSESTAGLHPVESVTIPPVARGCGTLDAAMAYARCGLYVLPTRASGSKNAGGVVGNHWQEKSSRDPHVLTSWFAATDHGLVLHLGRSGLVGFDLDVDDWGLTHPDMARAVGELNPPFQRTRRGATVRGHYLFAVPPGVRLGNGVGDLLGLDVRGQNGVIAVVPTRHRDAANGGEYAWARIGPVPMLPDYLLAHLPESPAGGPYDAATDAEVLRFLGRHDAPTSDPDLLERHVLAFRRDTAEGKSRHQTIVGHLVGAMKDATTGRLNATEAAERLREEFCQAATRAPLGVRQGAPRTEHQARVEFDGMLAWAVGQASGADPEVHRRRLAELAGVTEVPAAELIGTATDGAPAAALTVAATGEVLTGTAALEAFWTSRTELTHIRQWAQAQLVAPWAVLGEVLLRAVAVIPPRLTLPEIVGGRASLNLFVALVGVTGHGKGGSSAVAAAAVRIIGPVNDLAIVPVGTGEGLTHQFARYIPKAHQVEQYRESVIFTAAEVDTLAALFSRQGTTLKGSLKLAYMGEELGFANADPARTVILQPHTYRLGLSVGVQPTKAQPLFDDADGGTPQRFLFLPTADPDAPEEDVPRPDEPLVINLTGIAQQARSLQVPSAVRKEVRTVRRAVLRGNTGGSLSSHRMLARLKVAQALALIGGRLTMSDEDWELAEVIMVVSDHTRDQVQAAMARARQASVEARQQTTAKGAAASDEAVHQQQLKRACEAILRYLTNSGGEMSVRELTKNCPRGMRDLVPEALDRLTASFQVAVIDLGNRRQMVKLLK